MRPNMWTPQSLHAWRWMVAAGSTIASLSAFAVIETVSRGTTPTTEKMAPSGFQHGATTGVVVGHIACDGDLNRLVRAQALQRAALEAGGSGNDAGIDRGWIVWCCMDLNSYCWKCSTGCPVLRCISS